jgi:hypothetical protein
MQIQNRSHYLEDEVADILRTPGDALMLIMC